MFVKTLGPMCFRFLKVITLWALWKVSLQALTKGEVTYINLYSSPFSHLLNFLSVLPMLLVSLMLLLTHVYISEAARSCIICEMEMQPDALPDIHWELEMIVTLVQGSHTSSTTIFLGSTTLGEIREIEGQRHRERRFKSHGLKVKKRLYHAVVDANNDSSEFHRFCDTELLKMYYSVKTIRPTAVGGHFLFFILLAFDCKKARHKKQQQIRMWVFTSAKKKPH